MGVTILVVDDSVTMRMIVQSALSEAGWNVVAAGNGKDALALAARQPVDLVVSDWNMPVMNGLEFITQLRERSDYQHVPILVLTTEDDTASKSAARDLGVCGWLHKPVDPEVLVDMAGQLLEQSGHEDLNRNTNRS